MFHDNGNGGNGGGDAGAGYGVPAGATEEAFWNSRERTTAVDYYIIGNYNIFVNDWMWADNRRGSRGYPYFQPGTPESYTTIWSWRNEWIRRYPFQRIRFAELVTWGLKGMPEIAEWAAAPTAAKILLESIVPTASQQRQQLISSFPAATLTTADLKIIEAKIEYVVAESKGDIAGMNAGVAKEASVNGGQWSDGTSSVGDPLTQEMVDYYQQYISQYGSLEAGIFSDVPIWVILAFAGMAVSMLFGKPKKSRKGGAS